MSSTGQAFVKSFARRSQTNSTNARSTKTAPQGVSAPAAVTTASEVASTANAAEVEPAELWVDSFDDTVHRPDRASGTVPAPHLHASSLQHTHTAYDSAGHTVADDPIETESAPNSESPNPETQPSESPEAILAARVAKVFQPSQAITKSLTKSADSETTDEEFAFQYYTTDERLAVDLPVDLPAETHSSLQTNSPTSQALRPNWEVDVFDIPQSVADLFFEKSLFQDLSDRMKEASLGGLRTMLMTSAMAGEGRTTVAIGVALAAASSGLRVALVDGDLAEPTLAEELRLDLDHSWVETIRRGMPIKEVAVHAVEDNLTLFPLLPTDSGRQATAVECAQLIESLKPSFDLIIVDGPTADARDIRMLGSAIDSVIIVHDVNQSSEAAADLLAARLQRSGIDGVGIVENFV